MAILNCGKRQLLIPFPMKIPGKLLLALALPALAFAADPKKKAYDDPKTVDDPDFKLQGEYSGTYMGDKKIGVQIIALGGGKFSAVSWPGGLPGDGGNNASREFHGELTEGLTFKFKDSPFEGILTEDGVQVRLPEGKPVANGLLKKVERESPTLGAKPPEGAVVLFDGTSVEGWKGKMTEDGLLMQGAESEQRFTDFSLHLEFRLPYMPEARGQGRGNSGYYAQGRYEVQMLDSFGLQGKDNECGGIYKTAEPNVNMCFPPLRWQTYDVDFTAAKFDAEGKKTANARITVKHNGTVIHDNLELPGPTGGARVKGEQGPGPVFLQDHGNPVRYRNIWVVPKS